MALEKTAASNLKKFVHNGIERKRKQKIFGLIDEIINLLPFQHEMIHENKSKKLERILAYIKDLRNKNDALMFANPESVLAREIQKLRKQIEKLEKIIQSYQNILKSAGVSPEKVLIDPSIPEQWQKRPLKYSSKLKNDENNSHESDNDSDSGLYPDSQYLSKTKSKMPKLDHQSKANPSPIMLQSSSATGSSSLYLIKDNPQSLFLVTGNNIAVPLQLSSISTTIDANPKQPISPVTKPNQRAKNNKKGQAVVTASKMIDSSGQSKKSSSLTTTIVEQQQQQSSNNDANDDDEDIIFLCEKPQQPETTSAPSPSSSLSKIDVPNNSNVTSDTPKTESQSKNSDENVCNKPEVEKPIDKSVEITSEKNDRLETRNIEEPKRKEEIKTHSDHNEKESMQSMVEPISSKTTTPTSSSYHTANLLLQTTPTTVAVNNQTNKSTLSSKTPISAEIPGSLFPFGRKPITNNDNNLAATPSDSTLQPHPPPPPSQQHQPQKRAQSQSNSLYHTNFDVDYHSIYHGDGTSLDNQHQPSQQLTQASNVGGTSTFGHHHPSYQSLDGSSSYSSQSQIYPGNLSPTNQTSSFPPPFPPIQFDSNMVFGSSSPHKTASMSNIQYNHGHAHQFNNLLDFQSSNNNAGISDNSIRYPSISSTRQASSSSTAKSSTSSANIRSTKKSNANNSSGKNQRSGGTNSSSSSSNKTSAKKSSDQTSSSVPGSSTTSVSGSKRTGNENYFMIPDIISTSNQTSQSNYASNSENLLYGNHNVQQNNRYANFFTTTTEQQPDSPPPPAEETRTSQEISSCYPILFRPHNTLTTGTSNTKKTPTISSITLAPTTSTYSRGSNYHHQQPPQQSSQPQQQRQSQQSHSNNYYPTGSSTNINHQHHHHVPNFNLSNIFPDITSTSSSTSTADHPPPPPVSSITNAAAYPTSYIVSSASGSGLDHPFGSSSFTSTGGVTSNNSLRPGGCSSSFVQPQNGQPNGFLTKFPHHILSGGTAATNGSSSSSISSIIIPSTSGNIAADGASKPTPVDSMSSSGLNHLQNHNGNSHHHPNTIGSSSSSSSTSMMAKTYYNPNQSSSNHNAANYPQHFYPPPPPPPPTGQTHSNFNNPSGSDRRLPPLSSTSTATTSLTTTSTTNYHLMPAPSTPDNHHHHHHHHHPHHSFGFPYPMEHHSHPHHHAHGSSRIAAIGSDPHNNHNDVYQNQTSSLIASSSTTLGSTITSTTTGTSLGTFGKSSMNSNGSGNSSGSSNVPTAVAAAPPPPHHLSFPHLFSNLPRSDL